MSVRCCLSFEDGATRRATSSQSGHLCPVLVNRLWSARADSCHRRTRNWPGHCDGCPCVAGRCPGSRRRRLSRVPAFGLLGWPLDVAHPAGFLGGTARVCSALTAADPDVASNGRRTSYGRSRWLHRPHDVLGRERIAPPGSALSAATQLAPATSRSIAARRQPGASCQGKWPAPGST
jgi:hypothetical protein